MASLGLRENVILTKFILTTDGTKVCAKGNMVPSRWHSPGKDHTYQNVDVKCVVPYHIVAERSVTHCGMATAKVLLEMEARGVLQDLIPNVGQLECAYVPIKEWITDADVHGLLGGPGNTVCLPIHYGEIVHMMQ